MTDTPPDAPPLRIHGHDVMAMMLESARPMTRAELKAAIIARFGPDARFHTCSAEGMTAAGIIDFLDARGKFTEAGGKLSTDPARICSHDDDDDHHRD